MKISAISNTFTINRINNVKHEKTAPLKNDSFERTQVNYAQAIPFEGVNAKGIVKQRGIFMHITSLPAHRSFCGQFGDPQTDKFINWMADAKQTHWIMNPLNALEDHLCPYSPDGRFSRNKFIVNLNKLVGEDYGKLLKENELPDDITAPMFTLDMLEKQKNPRFQLAFERFKKVDETHPIKQQYNNFIKENNELWLDDYANYDAISKDHGKVWTMWDKALQTAPEDAKANGVSLSDWVAPILKHDDYKDRVELYKFEQFLYDKQFNEMVDQLNGKGIHLTMDLPIGVSATGVDTWGKKNIFHLDKNFQPTKVSGCPPEDAYPYTQVWKHALYNYDEPAFWDYQEAAIKQMLKTSDLRLDHFVGYINRAAIPTSFTKADGTILHGDDIFKPTSQGGMGVGFWKPEWVEDIYHKKSPKGENIIELFIRSAKEVGKKPEDTFVLEDFGPLAQTELYKEYSKKYGEQFISQRVPVAMGISGSGVKWDALNSPFNIKPNSNVAILTGNHDLPPLKQFIDELMDVTTRDLTPAQRNAQTIFREFCRKELEIDPKDINNKELVYDKVMEWHYKTGVKQVQTTLSDALGIYYRPNIPGFWNGHHDRYLMKTTPEALLPFWSRVFPKDFLSRDNMDGINPGYKKAADKFVEMMQKLSSNE
ncbi:MAG: 4-alpha-glucanotransferase [Fusobacterium sp.]|nr:4-alpha-glucanotransferase [Fusobacterium sp.]